MTQIQPTKTHLLFTYHTDPGHGWLEVSRDLLVSLGAVATTITPYSYQNQGKVFLEEDCDAGYFLDAFKAAGNTFEIMTNHVDSNSEIRRFKAFSLTEEDLEQLDNLKNQTLSTLSTGAEQ